ncbi:hypothetical protein Unana1_04828 [Umbelopsis nana]
MAKRLFLVYSLPNPCTPTVLGYCFKSSQDIHPYAEDCETGMTVQWAALQARRLNAFIMVGYPQIVKDRRGNLVTTYQKTFLYQVDEAWAQEGPAFKSMYIEGLGKVGFGICMDLNPYQFKTNFHDYEFANFHLEQGTELLLCCMSWISSKDDEDERCMPTLEYWAMRLSPLINQKPTPNKYTVFLACNRHGIEEGK